MLSRRLTAFIFALLLSSVACEQASAMYLPGAGRFCSRDPIGYGAGDASLYRYVFSTPTNLIDPSGLRYHEEIVTWPDWRIKRVTPDGGAFTRGAIEEKGDDEIEEFKKPGCPDCHCALVKRAKTINLYVQTALPEGGIGTRYTARGFIEIMAHEARRRQVKRIAYDAFLDPAQETGAHVTRCGLVCSKSPTRPKALLKSYLKELRSNAKSDWNAYNSAGQLLINTIEDENQVFLGTLFDHFANVAQMEDTDEPTLPDCPNSDCFPDEVFPK